MQTLDDLDSASLRTDIPDFRPGDTVKVHVKVVEGNKTRVQIFQGVVIARSGSGVSETFTVRKVSYGVGVERTFPLHTPIIEKIEVVTRGDVRRAKLYYLRELRGKKAKIREKRDNASSGSPVAFKAASSFGASVANDFLVRAGEDTKRLSRVKFSNSAAESPGLRKP